MKSRDVYIFTFEGMTNWEPIAAVSGINNPPSGKCRHHVLTVGTSTRAVTTSCGRRVVPDLCVSEIRPDRGAMLILPGGDLWTTDDCDDILDAARRFRICGVSVAAISGATLALARAGMLDDFHHTSNSREYLAVTGYRGSAFYCDVPAIADEGLITASQSAPDEFVREIFSELGISRPPSLDAWHELLRFGDLSRYTQRIPCPSR